MDISKYLISEEMKIDSLHKKEIDVVKSLGKKNGWKVYSTEKGNPIWDNDVGNKSKGNTHIVSAKKDDASILIYFDKSLDKIQQQIKSKKLALKKVTANIKKGDAKKFFDREG